MKAFVVLAAVLATAAAEADPALLYSGLGIHGLGYSNDAVSAAGYAAKGQYVANSAGVVHVAKREAEAEPALVYSGLHGLHGYGYAGLPYATTYAAPLLHSSHVGLCLNYVGQRVPC